MRISVMVSLLLFLGSCSPSTISKVDQFEKGVIEPRVDAAYDETVKRWCRMPVDIHNRAISRNTITPRSLTDNCSDWRAIRDALVGNALNQILGPEVDFLRSSE